MGGDKDDKLAPVLVENLLVNGSFETPNIGGSTLTYAAGSATLTGWTISGNSIEHIGSFWQTTDGAQSVQTAVGGGGSGGILSQTFSTQAGVEYRVTFDLATNWYPANYGQTFSLNVAVDSFSDDFEQTVPNDANNQNMGYVAHSFTFVADGSSATLVMQNAAGVDGGLVIDHVQVSPQRFDLERAENANQVIVFNAFDGDAAPTLAYTVEGDDTNDFAISSNGILSFKDTPDFEAPTDKDGDGVYELTVKVSDGTKSDTQDLTVTVTNEADTIPLAGLQAHVGVTIKGDTAGDAAGWSVSGAGDVNGDGFADVIVGALHGDDGGTSAGEAYVVFGTDGGFGTNGVIDLTTLDSSQGFIIKGAAASDTNA